MKEWPNGAVRVRFREKGQAHGDTWYWLEEMGGPLKRDFIVFRSSFGINWRTFKRAPEIRALRAKFKQ